MITGPLMSPPDEKKCVHAHQLDHTPEEACQYMYPSALINCGAPAAASVTDSPTQDLVAPPSLLRERPSAFS